MCKGEHNSATRCRLHQPEAILRWSDCCLKSASLPSGCSPPSAIGSSFHLLLSSLKSRGETTGVLSFLEQAKSRVGDFIGAREILMQGHARSQSATLDRHYGISGFL